MSVTLYDTSDQIDARDARLVGSRFDDVNLAGTTVSNADLTDCQFDNVNLTGVRIRDANLTNMTINGVKVSDLFAAYEKTKA